MKLLITLLTAVTLHAQATVMFKPYPFNYAGYRIWSVTIKSDGPTPQRYGREAIVQLVPDVHELPLDISKEVLHDYAARRPANMVAAVWRAFSHPASSALTIGGATSHADGMLFAAAGIEAANMMIALLQATTAKPDRYFSDLLPEVVQIPAAPGGATYAIVAQLAGRRATLGPFHLDAAGEAVTKAEYEHRMGVIMGLKLEALRAVGAEQ
jgi:hypothetical protein